MTTTYNELDIQAFEAIGKTFAGNKDEKKKEVRAYIIKKNKEYMDQLAEAELVENEYIETHFDAYLTSMNYLANAMSAEYSVMMIAAAGDIPVKYHVYLSNNQVMIYEMGKLGKVGRQYVFEYADINQFKVRKYKKSIKLCFKVEKDKYNQFRMVSHWFLYMFVNRKIGLNIISEDREQILKLIRRHLE